MVPWLAKHYADCEKKKKKRRRMSRAAAIFDRNPALECPWFAIGKQKIRAARVFTAPASCCTVTSAMHRNSMRSSPAAFQKLLSSFASRKTTIIFFFFFLFFFFEENLSPKRILTSMVPMDQIATYMQPLLCTRKRKIEKWFLMAQTISILRLGRCTKDVKDDNTLA